MFKRKSVNLAALLALGAISAPVFAQQQSQQLERVEITGTRIKTVNTETASPVISLGAEAIKIEARRDVEGLLNNLPQVFADYGGEVSNGATGTATVNLRNLGASRTLVLINGRRVPAGSPRNLAADLNQIPVSLIKRVEVLTGGASAVYGSDAVAGVVNFIMNDKFEGVELDLNYQFYNHSQQATDISKVVAGRAASNPSQFKVPGDKSADGKTRDFALTMGSAFANGKGHATLFVGRKVSDALLQSERDFTACALAFDAASGAWSCGGSSTSYPGRFLDLNTGTSWTVADASGGTRRYSGGTDQYNYGPLNYFQRPSKRTTAAAYANYDINEMAKVYAEMNFHDDSTVAQIAPSGSFLASTEFVGANAIKFENPLLSQAWRTSLNLNQAGDTADLWIGRRNVEGGGRQDDVRHTSYRGVIGVRGDLGANFGYDAYVQSSRVLFQETYKNDFSNTRIYRAMDVVTDPATGQAVCRTALDGTDPACVPYNIWSLGKVTPEALAYISTPGFQRGHTAQSVAGVSVNGDLTDMGIKSPMARSGLGFAVGFERRRESMELNTDTAFTTGDLAGQGGPTIGVGGGYSVNDVFGELRLPLMERMPLAERLQLNATYRRSSYSTSKSADTYGLGLEYQPVKMVTVRGSYQNASRSPNVIELFSAQSIGLFNMTGDPCEGAAPTATREQCARTGLPANLYGLVPENPAGQYNQLGGGNPNLKPEVAKSVTFGAVFQPMRDLTLSVDYFSIKVEDQISGIGAAISVQQCIETGNPLFCGKINRDSRGSLLSTTGFVVATTDNIGKLETEGIDIAADYGMKLPGLGKLDFSLVGTHLRNYVVTDVPGLASYDCAGYFGNLCGTPLPSWRNKLRASWTTPWDFQVALTWRHMASVKLDANSTQSRLKNEEDAAGNVAQLGSRDYLDVAAAYNLTKNVTLRLAVNNLLDKDPPLAVTGAPFGNGNTYPVVYDAAGRRVNINLNAKF